MPRVRSSSRSDEPPPKRADEAVSDVVERAASVFDQEVSVATSAAKRATQRFFDVQSERSQDPEAVFERFRKDAHEAVDMLVDAANAAIATLNDLARDRINTGERRDPPRTSAARSSGARSSAARGKARTSTTKAGRRRTSSAS